MDEMGIGFASLKVVIFNSFADFNLDVTIQERTRNAEEEFGSEAETSE